LLLIQVLNLQQEGAAPQQAATTTRKVNFWRSEENDNIASKYPQYPQHNKTNNNMEDQQLN
jgi:hypothetical protein